MLYPELDFLDRFEAAAQDGFKAVEYLFPYAYESREIAARLKAHGLQQAAAAGGESRRVLEGHLRSPLVVGLKYAHCLERLLTGIKCGGDFVFPS